MEHKLVIEEGSQILLPTNSPQADLPHSKIGSHIIHLILSDSIKHSVCRQSKLILIPKHALTYST